MALHEASARWRQSRREWDRPFFAYGVPSLGARFSYSCSANRDVSANGTRFSSRHSARRFGELTCRTTYGPSGPCRVCPSFHRRRFARNCGLVFTRAAIPHSISDSLSDLVFPSSTRKLSNSRPTCVADGSIFCHGYLFERFPTYRFDTPRYLSTNFNSRSACRDVPYRPSPICTTIRQRKTRAYSSGCWPRGFAFSGFSGGPDTFD